MGDVVPLRATKGTAREQLLAMVANQDEESATILSKAYNLCLLIYQQFSIVQRFIEESKFEPNAVNYDVFAQLTIDAQAVFLTLLTVVQHRFDPANSAVPEAVRIAALRFNEAVAGTLAALADQLEGRGGRPMPNLHTALTSVEQTVEAHGGGVVDSEVVAHIQTRLAVYRHLVPLVEQLVSHPTPASQTKEGEPQTVAQEAPTQG